MCPIINEHKKESVNKSTSLINHLWALDKTLRTLITWYKLLIMWNDALKNIKQKFIIINIKIYFTGHRHTHACSVDALCVLLVSIDLIFHLSFYHVLSWNYLCNMKIVVTVQPRTQISWKVTKTNCHSK